MKTKKANCKDLKDIWENSDDVQEFIKLLESRCLYVDINIFKQFKHSKERENIYIDIEFIHKIEELNSKLISNTEEGI